MNVPAAVGVPEMVIVLLAHVALTPAGKPLAPLTPASVMPVAPVVAMVITGKTVLRQSVGIEEGALAVLRGVMVTTI